MMKISFDKMKFTILTIYLLPFLIFSAYHFKTAFKYYTSAFIDYQMSYAGFMQLSVILFAILSVILLGIVMLILKVTKEQEMIKFSVNSWIIILLLYVIIAIPLSSGLEKYYINNNIFAAIKYKDDSVQNIKPLVNDNTINSKNFEGRSPIAVALIQEKFIIADFLVKNGASLDVKEQMKEEHLDLWQSDEVQIFLKNHTKY